MIMLGRRIWRDNHLSWVNYVYRTRKDRKDIKRIMRTKEEREWRKDHEVQDRDVPAESGG